MSGECIKCERDSYDRVCWSCEKIEKLEQENKKLKDCVEFYDKCSDGGFMAAQTLKDIKG